MTADLTTTTITTTRARSGSASSVSSTDSQVALPSFEHLAPPRERTTEDNAETALAVPGVRDVRLKVDAGPGCGGIAWPAGEVSRPVLGCGDIRRQATEGRGKGRGKASDGPCATAPCRAAPHLAPRPAPWSVWAAPQAAVRAARHACQCTPDMDTS